MRVPSGTGRSAPSSGVLRSGSNPALRATSRSRTDLPAATPNTLVDLTGAAPAEQAFECARIQLRRGAFEEAFALVERACSAEPEQPGPVAEEILATLTWAARQRRTDTEIRIYRARVLQRLGRHDQAIREFAVVASIDEKNLEAIREVRLHRAREESRAATSGMFGKLLEP